MDASQFAPDLLTTRAQFPALQLAEFSNCLLSFWPLATETFNYFDLPGPVHGNLPRVKESSTLP